MNRPSQHGAMNYRRVELDELAASLTAAVDQLGPVVVEGCIRDWHLSDTIGRGQLLSDNSRLQVVVFRWKQRHGITDGNTVRVVGRVECNQRFGLQLIADQSIEPTGVDQAHAARATLLERLADTTTKQHELSSPDTVKSVLLIGPKNGSAAIRDAQNVLEPLGLHVIVSRIAMAGHRVGTDLRLAMTNHFNVDLVLVVRGGGAASDLSAFDSPKTIEAVASHRVPIIAGIGHATNTTGFDLAVWKSAPTPSLAAQAVVDLIQHQPARRPRPVRQPRPATARPKPVAVPAAPRTNARQPVRWDLVAAAVVVLVAVVVLILGF